jgi:carboxylesterase type B
LAKNQDVVVVSINYRTNVFGFPFGSDTAEIPMHEHNLGLLDQELALEWARLNVHAFGGDPNRISLMGQSAGASSISWFLQRHPINPPFQSAVLLSSAFLGEVTPTTNEKAWTTFATAVGCTEPAGNQRLECLKRVPGSTIHDFFNGPNGPPTFTALIDKWDILSSIFYRLLMVLYSVTVFSNPVQRIIDRKVARVPLFQGGMQDDGSLFVLGQTDVGAFLNATFGPGAITPAEIAPLYPGLSGFPEISQVFRDISFVW